MSKKQKQLPITTSGGLDEQIKVAAEKESLPEATWAQRIIKKYLKGQLVEVK